MADGLAALRRRPAGRRLRRVDRRSDRAGAGRSCGQRWSGRPTALVRRWPALEPAWLPRTHEAMRVRLCRRCGRSSSARVDLAVGRPGRASRRRSPSSSSSRAPGGLEHRADLHFEALVETLRHSAPPFVVATYYTSTGELDVDPITEELLTTAARRVVAGVHALVRRCRWDATRSAGPAPFCAGSCSDAAPGCRRPAATAAGCRNRTLCGTSREPRDRADRDRSLAPARGRRTRHDREAPGTARRRLGPVAADGPSRWSIRRDPSTALSGAGRARRNPGPGPRLRLESLLRPTVARGGDRRRVSARAASEPGRGGRARSSTPRSPTWRRTGRRRSTGSPGWPAAPGGRACRRAGRQRSPGRPSLWSSFDWDAFVERPVVGGTDGAVDVPGGPRSCA